MKILKITLHGFLVWLLSTAAAAQNGATELSRTDDYGYYNDTWGYTAPDGREYAIIGTDNGTAFYNVTNPSAPNRVAFIPGPNSIWRDMKTLGAYCYIVTEGGGGMQIVSLVNPDSPTLVSNYGASIWSHAHNIAIDTATSLAYVVGADPNPGMVVLDLANPVAPLQLASYNTHEVHDAHIQNGLAHLAEIYDGHYRIVSVSTLPAFPSLDFVTTPGNFTHNVWANGTDSIAVTTDENTGGGLAFYDISNPSNIQLLSTWKNDNARVHNAFIKGNRAFMSWYSYGFACLDISNPSQPQQIASFDTNIATGPGFDGAWGVYPFAQSGLVYLSDQDGGLFVLRIDAPDFLLSGPTLLTVGNPASLNISGAAAGITWYLLRSFSNAASQIHGTPFELGTGASLLASGTTDLNGSANHGILVPPRVSGLTIFVEAATAQGTLRSSNMLRVQIQ